MSMIPRKCFPGVLETKANHSCYSSFRSVEKKTDSEFTWKQCIFCHNNMDIIFMVWSAEIERTHLVMNKWIFVKKKNTQNMFLNVLGHMQLPVLALLTGNSCPSVVSQYCGVAQVTSTLCTGHCSLHFWSFALLPFQTTQRAAPVTPNLCLPCLVMGRTTLKFPCSSSTTSKGSNSCRHWQTTPTFTSHFQLLQVVNRSAWNWDQ